MKRIVPLPIIDLSRRDLQPTQVVDLSRTMQLHTVRLEISENLLAELREAPAAETASQAVAPPAATASSFQSGDTLIMQPAPVRTLALALPRHLDRDPPRVDLANTLYDGGALRERAAQLASGYGSQTTAPKALGVPPPAVQQPARPQNRALAAFRASSLPKRLTVALLPLAIAGVWVMADGAASASAPGVPGAHSSAAAGPPAPAVAGSAASVGSAASTVNAASAGSATPMPSLAATAPTTTLEPAVAAPRAAALEGSAQPRDPSERLALIAAASGNKAEAAALYERLATKHNSRTFALAARLVQNDRVRKP
jgi:hypothetical protein